MFGQPRKQSNPKLEDAIDRVLSEMLEYGPDHEDYSNNIGYLERLTALKTNTRRQRVSPDQMALVAGNLLGILVIVAYEQKHVMASKGLGFVMKAK